MECIKDIGKKMTSSMLQIIGLSFKMQQDGTISPDKMLLLNSLTEEINGQKDKIISESSSLQEQMVAAKKDAAIGKRKFNEAATTMEELKAKVQILEKSKAELEEKYETLKEDMDSSWVCALDTDHDNKKNEQTQTDQKTKVDEGPATREKETQNETAQVRQEEGDASKDEDVGKEEQQVEKKT